jgi:hypothetical protein
MGMKGFSQRNRFSASFYQFAVLNCFGDVIDLNILIAFQIRYRAGQALGFNVAAPDTRRWISFEGSAYDSVIRSL